MNDPAAPADHITVAVGDHAAVVVGDTISYDRYVNGATVRRTAVVTGLMSDRFGATDTDTGAYTFVPHGRFVGIVNAVPRPGNARPIEVGDRADAPMPFGGMIVRGTVVDITHPTAILDLDNGGRVSVMVDDLRPVEQVYLAGGDLAIDADQATAVATFAGIERGTGLRIERNPNGVVVTVFDNNAGTSIDLNINFGRAAEVATWLHNQMYDPANDYSAHTRPAADRRDR